MPQAALSETLPVASARPEQGESGRAYLLVFAGASSFMVSVPPDAELVIGRSEDAHVRLHDASVSRVHAKVLSSAGEARLVDLGSHNGTRINGERVAGTRNLASGDVISVGTVTLVFHRDARAPARRPLLPEPLFRQRVEEEIERSLRYQRAMTVLALDLGGPADRVRISSLVSGELRLIDAASWDGDRGLLVLLPETVNEAAAVPGQRLLKTLSSLAPEARAGFATCPTDGCDVDTLLGSARAAARSSLSGKVAPAAEAATAIKLGEQSVVVADPAMVRLYGLLERLAVGEIPVLVCGETGVGKEIAATAVHQWSSRRNGPLVTVNCAALQESLLESELFGYERGAFSGADTAKPGRLESAAGGTLFLDEVGELSASAQAKLLRAVENKKISRLGSVTEREVDVRLVAATNRSLEDEVKAGRFRQDLFFRLSAATVNIPPLRDRTQDLPILARTFLAQACRRAGRPELTLSAAAMQPLLQYRWPGNVRELKNLMDYLAATLAEEQVVEPWLLPEKISGRPPTPLATPALTPPAGQPAVSPGAFRNIYDEIRELEQKRMQAALQAAGGVQVRAAELIGMPLRTFVTKLKQYNLGKSAKASEG